MPPDLVCGVRRRKAVPARRLAGQLVQFPSGVMVRPTRWSDHDALLPVRSPSWRELSRFAVPGLLAGYRRIVGTGVAAIARGCASAEFCSAMRARSAAE